MKSGREYMFSRKKVFTAVHNQCEIKTYIPTDYVGIETV